MTLSKYGQRGGRWGEDETKLSAVSPNRIEETSSRFSLPLTARAKDVLAFPYPVPRDITYRVVLELHEPFEEHLSRSEVVTTSAGARVLDRNRYSGTHE